MLDLRAVAQSAYPFIEDVLPHPFEKPPIPIFSRDALQVVDAYIGFWSGDSGPPRPERKLAVVDPRYGVWHDIFQDGLPDNENYTLASDVEIYNLQSATRGDYAAAMPPYPLGTYQGAEVAAAVLVGPNVYRVVTYTLAGDYWRPTKLAFIPKPSDTAMFLEVAQMAAAVVGFAAAGGMLVAGLQSGNLGLNTVVRFATAVDRLPGVDLGDATDVLRYVSRLTSAQGALSSLTDAGGSATSDALLSTGDPMDDFSFGDFGDAPAFGDMPFGDAAAGFGGSVDFGDGFGYAWGGEWADSIGTDVVDQAFESLALPPTFDSALDSLTSQSGSIFGNLDIGNLLTQLATTYVQYDIAKRQIEARGGTVPPTVRPTPGQTRTLPDGTTIRTNNDGTTTVRTPDGATRTVTQGGQIITQTPAPAGGSIVPGLSNQTLLIGGAVAVGALLLLSRRKG